jgi:hypothetical protein
MAKKKKKDEYEPGSFDESSTDAAENRAAEAKELDEKTQKLVDTLKERQQEHIDAAQEKIDKGEDASSDLAAAQEINKQIQVALAEDEFVLPTGQEHSAAGAAGTCVVGPVAHEKIMALGGEIVDDVFSGHASVHALEEPQVNPLEEHQSETAETT